jgi:hypothetical protein
MTKNNKDILMIIGGIAALAAILIISSLVPQKTEFGGAKVITNKDRYKIGENLKVKIKNGLKTDICFSSCSPYYFERKDGSWEAYQYSALACQSEDVAKPCVRSKTVKAFELNIPSTAIKKGVHRLAIPACIGCSLFDRFKKDKWFYSNQFIIQ